MQGYDLAVIGGGINGAGIARDAAGRGLSVLLVEQHDLASGTSSASTKLIHGGLRYLEQFKFRLVGESLAEREILLAMAPHTVWPQQFVLPHEPHLRPAWMIRAGLFLYDQLGRGTPLLTVLGNRRSSLPRSKAVSLDRDGLGAALKRSFRRGFSYYDCSVDDARLVVLNARSAALRGADIRTRTQLVAARRDGQAWTLQLHDRHGRPSQVMARAVVNAAGPWAQEVLEAVLKVPATGRMRRVRGSHIVVPRLHAGDQAYLLQNPDGRVIFVIPYEGAFSLIGTTDVALSEDDDATGTAASEAEITYLCQAVSRYMEQAIEPQHVVWTYSGVRALYDDGRTNPSTVTRDWHLLLDAGEGGRDAPVLSVFGGKLTTYRRVAEAVLQRLASWFPRSRSWTHAEPLPGGDCRPFPAFVQQLQHRYPGLPPRLVAGLARRHGTLAVRVLGTARRESDLGERFGGGLCEAEVRYLIEHEWAQEADDILWRRTKCGLHMSEPQRRRLADVVLTLF